MNTDKIFMIYSLHYGGSFVILCLAVAIFAYLTSKGKKKLGVISGTALSLLAIIWLLIAPDIIY